MLTAAEQDKAIDLFAAIPFDPQPLELSPEQQQVLTICCRIWRMPDPYAALLHGVTGSGKTIVFLRLIQRTLELGPPRTGPGAGDQPDTADDTAAQVHLRQPSGRAASSALNNTERLCSGG